MSDWWSADPVASAPQDDYGKRISSIESGGNYRAVGPQTGKGRALGKYQVMDFNVGPWTKEALGQEMTPMQFLSSPEAQEAVFKNKFGGYVQKYGPEGAARAWFAGEDGMNNPNARDVLGTSVADYSRKFTSQGPLQASSANRQPQGNWWANDPVAEVPQQAAPQQAPAQVVQERFAPVDIELWTSSEAPRMKSALTQQARQMQGATRGPAADPLVRQSVEFQNQQIAAGQGVTPNMDLQMQNLITDQVYENDAGLAVFKDPATGQLVEADIAKHVILRDPQDNRLKVFGRSEATSENPAVSASRILSSGLAAGAPTARAAVPSVVQNVRRGPVPTREQLYEAADAGYTAARDLGVRYNPAAVGDMAFKTQGALVESGFNEITAPRTYQMLGKFGNKADEASPNAAASFNDLDSVRKGLGKIAQGHSSPDAIVRSDAAAASEAINRLDEFFANPAGAVAGDAGQLSRIAETARGNFAAAKRSERVGRAEDLADLQAASGGSGANIDNAMRQRIKDILKSKKEAAGFSKEELEQMYKIVRGTPAGNTARLLGKLAPTGIVSGALSGGAGAAIGGGAGAVALPLVGFAAKKMSDVMTANQLSKLDELVRSRSPLGRQIESALQDWNTKANALADVPNAPKVAQFALASRNLVNNLKDAGITISPSEFMKVLQQGPMRSAADNEQPEPERVINQ
jgi:hypothetical protein